MLSAAAPSNCFFIFCAPAGAPRAGSWVDGVADWTSRRFRLRPGRRAIAEFVADTARRWLGPQWVPTALRIAKVESGFACHAVGPWTRHGHAMGVMQVLPSSAYALGYRGPPAGLLDCETGIEVGIAHMRRCIEQLGARTQDGLAFCHVGGVPWSRGRYSREYVRLVRNAPLPVGI